MAGEDKVFRLPPIVRPKEPVKAAHINAFRTALSDLSEMIRARTPQPSADIGHRYGPGGFSLFLKRRGASNGHRFKPREIGGKLFIGKGTVTSFLPEGAQGLKTPHYPTLNGTPLDAEDPPFIDLAGLPAGADYVVAVKIRWDDSTVEAFNAEESLEDLHVVVAEFTLDADRKVTTLKHLFTSDILLPTPTLLDESDSGSSASGSSDSEGGGGSSGSGSSSSSASDPTPDCDFDISPPEWGWCTTNPTEVACPPLPNTRQSPIRCIEWEFLVPSEYRGVGCINFWLKIQIDGGYEMVANNPDDGAAARNTPVADYALIELTGTTLPDIGSCEFAQRVFTECTDHTITFEVVSEHDQGSGSVPESAHPCCGLLGRWRATFKNPPCSGRNCTSAPLP